MRGVGWGGVRVAAVCFSEKVPRVVRRRARFDPLLTDSARTKTSVSLLLCPQHPNSIWRTL